MSEIVIREAKKSDAALLLALIKELARYEKAEHEVLATEGEIRASLCGPTSSAYGLICERGEQAIGYAVYFFNYSTWLGKHGLYLEDLYVTPQERGRGAGKAMLKYLARRAVERGCGRFEWSVLDWNEPSIKFYESLGAKAQNEWVGYRLAGRELTALAES